MTNQVSRQAILVTQSALAPGQVPIRLALFTSAGAPVTDLTESPADTGATVLLTGFTTHAVGNVASSDTVNDALGKLQARIVVLETAVADHETRLDAAEITITDHESRLDVLEA